MIHSKVYSKYERATPWKWVRLWNTFRLATLSMIFSVPITSCSTNGPNDPYCFDLKILDSKTKQPVQDIKLIAYTCNAEYIREYHGSNEINFQFPGGCNPSNATIIIQALGFVDKQVTLYKATYQQCTEETIYLEPQY